MSGGTVSQRREEELELIKRVSKETRKAVITGPAAARWLGLATLDWVEQVDLLLPGASKAWGSKRGYTDRVYRSASISEGDIHIHKDVRVVTGIRALFDTYRYHGRQEALVQI